VTQLAVTRVSPPASDPSSDNEINRVSARQSLADRQFRPPSPLGPRLSFFITATFWSRSSRHPCVDNCDM
jgi:hypothetical protein